jgi:hypothetical protein
MVGHHGHRPVWHLLSHKAYALPKALPKSTLPPNPSGNRECLIKRGILRTPCELVKCWPRRTTHGGSEVTPPHKCETKNYFNTIAVARAVIYMFTWLTLVKDGKISVGGGRLERVKWEIGAHGELFD